MKKNIKYIVAVLLLMLVTAGCEDVDFNKEMYKNVVYLLSDNDQFNVYDRAIADLNKDVDTLYITVGVSGSKDAPADIPVVLTSYYKPYRIDSATYQGLNKDRLFYQYNKSRYDIEFEKWGVFLPEAHYDFLEKNRAGNESSGSVNLKAIIPQNTSKVTIPVIVKNLSMLSPDSTYFMDYEIESAGDFEINKDKRNVLIPIYWKNNWTNTKKPLSYDMSGEQFSLKIGAIEPLAGSQRMISGSPILFPLSKNEIRVAAGNLSIDKTDDATAREQIDNHSIILKVNDDNTVDIRSYKNIIVEKVLESDLFYDAESANKFFVDEQLTTLGITKYFLTFRIHYRYRLLKDNKHPLKKHQWVYVRSQLRYEFQPSAL